MKNSILKVIIYLTIIFTSFSLYTNTFAATVDEYIFLPPMELININKRSIFDFIHSTSRSNLDQFNYITSLNASDIETIHDIVQHELEKIDDKYIYWEVDKINQEESWAYATAIAYSIATKDRLATEPIIALAQRFPDGHWEAILPNNPSFEQWLAAIPVSLIDDSSKKYLRSSSLDQFGLLAQVSGYKLPWPGGTKGTVTARGGTGHTNQVDFNIWVGDNRYASGTVVAAKNGTVVFVKESSNSGCSDISCWRQANMVIIRHSSNEYSWYVHLAYQSVPDNVYVGASIPSGTPIGVEGSTGYSTGVHLHFHVSSDLPTLTDPNNPNAAPWPTTFLTFDFTEASWEQLNPEVTLVSQNNLSNGGCNNPSPNSDQIGLYADDNYCGAYKLLGVGEYPNPGALGVSNDSISSIKVGSNVKATLCRDDNYNGGCEDFTSDDSHLGDNSIGNDSVSSAKVTWRSSGNTLPSDYGYCAEEGQRCSFSGTAQIYYGANNQYVGPRTYTDGVDCNNTVFGDPIPGVHKQCFIKGGRPQGSTWCANENGTCSFGSGNVATVYYGANGKYNTKTGVISSIACNNSTFGDPFVGIGKACYYIITGSSISTPSNPSPSDNTTLPRTNNTVLSWSTNGTNCTIHIWGGSINISPANNCGALTLGQQRGGAYNWQVTASNSSGSATGPVWHFNIKPYPPTNLLISNYSATQVSLSWTLSSDEPSDVDEYYIYQNDQYVGSVSKGTSTYTVNGLSCSGSYSFYVKSRRQGVLSDSSNTVYRGSVGCPPSMPTNLSISNTTINSITLSWQDNSNNENGFKIYRWGYEGNAWGFYYLDSVGANVTSYTQKNLRCGNDFNFYEVSAFNQYGESAHAGWVQGITLPCLRVYLPLIIKK